MFEEGQHYDSTITGRFQSSPTCPFEHTAVILAWAARIMGKSGPISATFMFSRGHVGRQIISCLALFEKKTDDLREKVIKLERNHGRPLEKRETIIRKKLHIC